MNTPKIEPIFIGSVPSVEFCDSIPLLKVYDEQGSSSRSQNSNQKVPKSKCKHGKHTRQRNVIRIAAITTKMF